MAPAGEAEMRARIGASAGLGLKFNINTKWAIDVEARGAIAPSIFGNISSHRKAEGTENGRGDSTASFYVNSPLGVDIELQAQTGRSTDTCTHFSFTDVYKRQATTLTTPFCWTA